MLIQLRHRRGRPHAHEAVHDHDSGRATEAAKADVHMQVEHRKFHYRKVPAGWTGVAVNDERQVKNYISCVMRQF